MGVWWQLAIGVVVLWFVLRFVGSVFSHRESSESLEDPVWKILWRVCHRPKNGGRRIDLAR